MKSIVAELHELFNNKTRLSFPFEDKDIPKNGVYIIFQKGESFKGMDRIVRVGTHTGQNQLRSRLRQHFEKENKNRSIFRKNIGRCFLELEKSSYLPIWELDITSNKNREEKLKQINQEYERELEKRISAFIRENFSFCVFEVNDKAERLKFERKIISTLSNAALSESKEIQPSEEWLGNYSTKNKIKESGLWQVNELYKTGLTDAEFKTLKALVAKG